LRAFDSQYLSTLRPPEARRAARGKAKTLSSWDRRWSSSGWIGRLLTNRRKKLGRRRSGALQFL